MARAAELLEDPSLNKFCDAQLRLNQLRFEEYKRGTAREAAAGPHGLYGVTKVDTHLHLSALLTSPELLAYVAEARDGAEPYDDARTVGDVIRGAGFAPGETRIDDLQTQATSAMYRDFENFNLAFSPLRSRELGSSSSPRASSAASTSATSSSARATRRRSSESYSSRASPSTGGALASGSRSPSGTRRRGTRTSSSQSSSRASTTSGGPRGPSRRPPPMISNFFGPLFAASRDPAAHPALAALLADVRCVDTVDNEARADAFAVDGDVGAADHALGGEPVVQRVPPLVLGEPAGREPPARGERPQRARAPAALRRGGQPVLCGAQNLPRRRVRDESRRPPRHRRDACSMAWRYRFTRRSAEPGRPRHADDDLVE